MIIILLSFYSLWAEDRRADAKENFMPFAVYFYSSFSLILKGRYSKEFLNTHTHTHDMTDP